MDEAGRIRRDIASWREQKGKRTRVPAELRHRVIDYARRRSSEGASWYRVQLETDIGSDTVRRWIAADERAASVVMPVQVVAGERAAVDEHAIERALAGAPVSVPGQVTVTSPTGWCICGLGFEEVVSLLRALS